MEELYLINVPEENIDILNHATLKIIDLYWNNNLKSLKVTNNPNLETLQCTTARAMTSMVVENNDKLKYLITEGNTALTTLDVTKNLKSLEALRAGNNGLTSIKISKSLNPRLVYLNCFGNKLIATELNTIFGDLPIIGYEQPIVEIGGNAGTATCDRTIATGKQWRVVDKL